MRGIFYEALSGLPSKLISGAIGLGGMAATAWPEQFRQWVSSNMTPDQIRFYGIIGIALFIAYWALMIWLKPEANNGAGSLSQSPTTSGPNSPAIAAHHSTVNNYFGHPPTQKTPLRASEQANADIARALRNAEGYPPGLATYKRDNRCPEFPVWRAIAHIAGVIGDNDEHGCFAESRRVLRQAAHEGRIEVWGRRGIAPRTLSSPKSCSELWTAIQPDYWEQWKLNSHATGELWDGHDHTDPEAIYKGHLSDQYWSLRVDKDRLERLWQSPKDSKPNSYPARPTGPQGWMA